MLDVGCPARSRCVESVAAGFRFSALDGGYSIPCGVCARRYNEPMKTLTITEGRGRLGHWLKKATEGEDVGFVFEGKIVALRPVGVTSDDYALQEYGLTPAEVEKAEKKIRMETKASDKRGEMTPFTGGPDDFR